LWGQVIRLARAATEGHDRMSRPWELLKYRVVDNEENSLSFYCGSLITAIVEP